MIPRFLTSTLKDSIGSMPVTTVLGPRQSGKTTLVKSVLPEWGYVNLENPMERRLAETDPRLFFSQHPTPLIIDEVQRVPELLSWIQVSVDESGQNGQYVLTGSHQPLLRAGITQSLAGRTSVLTLWPLSMAELIAAGYSYSRDEWIHRGFLPRLFQAGISPARLYGDYYRTYVERDVCQLIEIGNRSAFETFLQLLAGRIGQVVNCESLAGDVGVSAPTLRKWLSVLEASYIVFRLPPYYNNFGKRFVKSPKIYFTDVGLASYLLRIGSPAQIARDPLLGGLFENLVVAEAWKWKYNTGALADFYFIRDNNGLEIDLVMEVARKLHLFEVKSAMSPDLDMGKNMRRLRKGVPDIGSSTVVYSGDDWPLPPDDVFLPFWKLSQHLEQKAHATS